MFHKATTELSSFATEILGKIFGDETYLKSPDMVFKLFASMSAVSLDDPQISAKLDALVVACGDTIDGRVLNTSDSFFSLLDNTKDDCQLRYADLRTELLDWVRENQPYYYVDMMSTDLSDMFDIFRDKELMDNKLIASALVNYGKSKTNGNAHHLNTEALNLGTSGYFWTSFQKIFTTDSFINTVNFMTGGDTNVESEMARNNAALLYNRLLNLLPWFRGAIKVVLALGFILAAAALGFGWLKPMVWWLGVLFMEAAYGPLSALAYHISAFFVNTNGVLDKLGMLKMDPMILMAAHEIDQSMAYLQTGYFVIQMVIIFVFCYGILKSGWAIRSTDYNPNFGVSQGVQKVKQAVTVFTRA